MNSLFDVGSNQGVLERGKMAVSRDGKLVAKLKIYSTEPNRSIANIMRDWRQLEVKEGDTVFTSYEALTILSLRLFFLWFCWCWFASVGCATNDPDNLSSCPWNSPKTWENGLPSGLYEGR
jgi:hypothetical protein